MGLFSSIEFIFDPLKFILMSIVVFGALGCFVIPRLDQISFYLGRDRAAKTGEKTRKGGLSQSKPNKACTHIIRGNVDVCV